MLALMAGSLALRVLSARRRDAAVRLPPGTAALRVARGVPVRIFTERNVTGGPVAGAANTGRANLVLTDAAQLFVSTHHGRVLQIDAASPGEARHTGPRRLVIEGVHPSGATRVRAELILDDAAEWAEAITALRADPT